MNTIALPNKHKLTILPTHHKLLTIFTFFLALLTSTVLLLALTTKTTSAATITVASGTDTIASDSTCHLSEAIQNINDQAQTNSDCPAGDGNNDTITLPTGTITLSANLPYITESITIQGQGMGTSIVDGDGAYKGFWTTPFSFESINLAFQNMTSTGFSEIAIGVSGSNVDIEKVEIDGNNATKDDSVFGPGTNILLGIFIIGQGNGSDMANISSVYVHDLSGSAAAAIRGINIFGMDHTISNTTIANIYAEDTVGVVGIGLAPALPGQPGITPRSSNSEISNVTIDGIGGNNINGLIAIGNEAYATTFDATMNSNIKNSVINDINVTGTNDFLSPFFVQMIAMNGSVNANTNLNSQNNLVSNSTGSTCEYSDATIDNGGTGTPVLNTTSNGGNISDTNGCSSWFNNATDSNNNSSLNSTLGTLGSYGGSVPTIPLLPGSPAIDNASCTGAPSTDARGITRPQGTNCDSGAYEVVQATRSTTTPTSSTAKLTTPQGVVVNSFNTISSSTTPTDNQDSTNYQYPLGLTSFELAVPTASTQEISIDFITDLTPDQVTARKYNTNNQTYTNLDNATITQTTVDDQPALKLTYSITDGVFPDLDGLANGTIVDPVGLATSSLANTGAITILGVTGGIILVVGGLYTYVDYRKHKRPLVQMDPMLAKQYTYWHHLKVVVIPLAKYRLQVIIEKKEPATNNVISN